MGDGQAGRGGARSGPAPAASAVQTRLPAPALARGDSAGGTRPDPRGRARRRRVSTAPIRLAAADMASALRQVRTGAGTPAARVWLALGTVYLLWGSTYLGIKYAL